MQMFVLAGKRRFDGHEIVILQIDKQVSSSVRKEIVQAK